MGTLCKNCPMKKGTTEPCTIAFARKYGSSCVTYDIGESQTKIGKNKVTAKKTSNKKTNTPKKNGKINKQGCQEDSL